MFVHKYDNNFFESRANVGTINYMRKNYKVAFPWTVKAAMAGMKEAQYAVGIMFDQGAGVTRNEETAVMWLK